MRESAEQRPRLIQTGEGFCVSMMVDKTEAEGRMYQRWGGRGWRGRRGVCHLSTSFAA